MLPERKGRTNAELDVLFENEPLGRMFHRRMSTGSWRKAQKTERVRGSIYTHGSEAEKVAGCREEEDFEDWFD